MYVNYDCDITCNNVFEDIANLLSKNAFPVNSPLCAVNLLALDGLTAIVQGIENRVGNENPFTEQTLVNSEGYKSFWTVKCESYDEFCVQVLQEFAKTFDFEGMSLDGALRLFLDQHNAQVKRKMTEEDFIRNNRCINAGKDLPREFLSELYHSISENEIQNMLPDQGAGLPVMTSSRWVSLLQNSKKCSPFIICDSTGRLDYDMFTVLSGPSIAAISVVIDNMDQEEVIQTCVNGFINIAKISACYHLNDILDDLVVSLCKFTTLLDPSSAEESILALVEDHKARLATTSVFTIANNYGDYIRTGWKNIVDCVLYLHNLGLLRLADETADNEKHSSESEKASQSALPALSSSSSRKSSGLMGRFSQLFSFEAEEPIPQSTLKELESHQLALLTIQSCQIVMPCTLVEKAVFGLLQICQRLLPYKENLTDELLKSLRLVLKLDARVADAYCEHISLGKLCTISLLISLGKMNDVFEGYGSQYCELSSNIFQECTSAGILILNGEQKKQKLSEIKGELDEAESLIRKMELEARLQPYVSSVLLAMVGAYKNDLNDLKNQVKRLSSGDTTSARDELLESGMADSATVSADQRGRLLMSMRRLNQSTDRVRESRKTMLETEGVSILHDLHSQGQPLLHAHNTLVGVDDNIGRSKRMLTNMSRRMNKKKWIIASVVTHLIIAIAVILYFKLK
ncbi:hypothetical protein QQ045_011596 [Rhodiola kirilowii]